jgi:5-methylcytosine-specific restriction protein A
MPSLAKRPCPRCRRVLVPADTLCERCQTNRNREREHYREGKRYTHTARHRRWRAAVLANDPLCSCGQGATVADHIKPLSQGGDYSLANGQGLCVRCHNRKTAREQPRSERGAFKPTREA